jgi:hypothetical protein
MQSHRDPHDEAHALLLQWGANYELITCGMYPHTQENGEDQAPPEKVQTSGHNDPTASMVHRRRHLLRIDAAVNRVPAHWRYTLMLQYVGGLSDSKAAEEAGRDRRAWARERDSARMLFLGYYQEARRLAQDITSGECDDAKPREVAAKA